MPRALAPAVLPLLLAAACAAPTATANPAVLADGHGRPVAVLEAAAYDRLAHEATCKVYHHVHAPDGRLLTKGLGGEFPHHRGLFAGWNRVEHAGQRFDFWHCRNGEAQRFAGFLPPAELGLAADWQVVAIDWTTATGQPVVRERRALRLVELAPDVRYLAVVQELAAVAGPVQLGGDPHHSGHQFRALQAFALPAAEPVRYLQPPGTKSLGNDVFTDCRWLAAVLPFAAGPVTVLRVEDPGNPGPARWSARPYGRFGAMVAAALTDRPLRLQYHYVVASGARDAAWCEATATAVAGAPR